VVHPISIRRTEVSTIPMTCQGHPCCLVQRQQPDLLAQVITAREKANHLLHRCLWKMSKMGWSVNAPIVVMLHLWSPQQWIQTNSRSNKRSRQGGSPCRHLAHLCRCLMRSSMARGRSGMTDHRGLCLMHHSIGQTGPCDRHTMTARACLTLTRGGIHQWTNIGCFPTGHPCHRPPSGGKAASGEL